MSCGLGKRPRARDISDKLQRFVVTNLIVTLCDIDGIIERFMGLLTVRFAQLQHDVGLGLGLLLHVASLGRDLVNVDDESGPGFGFLIWFGLIY